MFESVLSHFIETIPDAKPAPLAADTLREMVAQESPSDAVQSVESRIRHKLESVPDYRRIAEFESQMTLLAEFIPDEAQRVRAVTKQMDQAGTASGDIMAAYSAVLSGLEGQKREFQNTVTEMESVLAVARGSIEKMNQDIAALTSSRNIASQDLYAKEQKIAQTKRDFEAALQRLRSQYEAATLRLEKFGTK